MSMGPLYVLLGEVSIQALCPFLVGLFVFLVLSHTNSFYILEIEPLSNVSLTNRSSYMVSSLFILMMVSLAMQKLFNLLWSHLFISPIFSLP